MLGRRRDDYYDGGSGDGRRRHGAEQESHVVLSRAVPIVHERRECLSRRAPNGACRDTGMLLPPPRAGARARAHAAAPRELRALPPMPASRCAPSCGIRCAAGKLGATSDALAPDQTQPTRPTSPPPATTGLICRHDFVQCGRAVLMRHLGVGAGGGTAAAQGRRCSRLGRGGPPPAWGVARGRRRRAAEGPPPAGPCCTTTWPPAGASGCTAAAVLQGRRLPAGIFGGPPAGRPWLRSGARGLRWVRGPR